MEKRIYIKNEGFDPIYSEMSKGFYARTRLIPISLIISGVLVFVTQVAFPLVVFTTQDTSSDIVDNATVVGRAAGFSKFEFKELRAPDRNVLGSSAIAGLGEEEELPEYFPRKNASGQLDTPEGANTNKPEFFSISIPKLGIEDALVETNAFTLNPTNALGHYPNTVLPGEKGNSFIFGHSVLPWFFNPKNYKTIFSTLPKLETGDEILVNYNNQKMRYVVESKQELKPEDVNPLAQVHPSYLNDSTMVLMTCSPPGTKMKRLLVNAVLVK